MYNSVWRYASYTEFVRTLAGSLLTSVAHTVLITVLLRRMPISYYLMGAFFQFVLLIGARFAFRFMEFFRLRHEGVNAGAKRIMLIGAGNAAQMILREMTLASEVSDRVVCIIDDNPNKWHRYLSGMPIVGGRDEILSAVEKYHIDEIYLAIPSATAEQKRDILAICSETNCKLKQLPGLYQFVVGEATVSAMKDVSVEDLLGRDPIRTDMKEVFRFITGKVVLVTGGGGSIGSELCRQIAAHAPKQLIIFDVYENNAYSIQLELREKYPELNLETIIGSVRDSRRMFEVFEKYRPQVVYHAAAHKHVPLMEDSPCEAIKNNAIGTYKTAYAAMVHGCERFVLISTDKAVNPTNIMGASKRLCEMIIQSFDMKIKAGKAGEIPQLFTHDGTENADKDGTGKVFENIKDRVRGGALRQRAGQQRLGDPHLQEADREGRAGDGHPPGHHPLLHDHPRGGEPGDDGGGLRQGRRDLRAGHGQPGEDRHAGAEPDQAVGLQAGRGHQDRVHRPAPRREAVRGEADGRGGPAEDRQRPDPHRQPHQVRRGCVPEQAGKPDAGGLCQQGGADQETGEGHGFDVPSGGGTDGGRGAQKRVTALKAFIRGHRSDGYV